MKQVYTYRGARAPWLRGSLLCSKGNELDVDYRDDVGRRSSGWISRCEVGRKYFKLKRVRLP